MQFILPDGEKSWKHFWLKTILYIIVGLIFGLLLGKIL